jgi:ribokinase
MIDVVVIGSLNMDLVVRVKKMPLSGETVRGSDLATIPGGKGANQAAALALLGNRVTIIGCVGQDEFGSALIESQKRLKVQTERIIRDPDAATGTALITVDEQGNNSIIVSPGTNGRVSPEDVKQAEEFIKSAKFVLLQLEIPMETVDYAISLAHQVGTKVVLNPSPVMELPGEMLKKVDYLVINEIEAASISGMEVKDFASAKAAAERILLLGAGNVIVTLGAAGSLMMTRESVIQVPTVKVEPVDTTGAGDAFLGGFLTGLINDFSLMESVRYGNCAGAISATRQGAQTSLPDKESVNALFKIAQEQTTIVQQTR